MDLTSKKQSYANDLVALADILLITANQIDEMDQSYFANSFNTGGNAFVDGDFSTGSNTQLSAAIITGVITVIEAVRTALPQSARDNLRKALRKGLP